QYHSGNGDSVGAGEVTAFGFEMLLYCATKAFVQVYDRTGHGSAFPEEAMGCSPAQGPMGSSGRDRTTGFTTLQVVEPVLPNGFRGLSCAGREISRPEQCAMWNRLGGDSCPEQPRHRAGPPPAMGSRPGGSPTGFGKYGKAWGGRGNPPSGNSHWARTSAAGPPPR